MSSAGENKIVACSGLEPLFLRVARYFKGNLVVPRRNLPLRPIYFLDEGFCVVMERIICVRIRKERCMLLFKVLSFIFLVPGVLIVFGAGKIVSRFNLSHKVKCDYEQEMNESEIKEYKHNKAVFNMKMIGMLVALPGFILFLIAFK